HEHGAVDYLVPAESLIDTAVGVAVAWSGWSEHVREATKHLLHVETDNDLATHLDHERTLIEAAGTTQAFEEGVAAFLARRRPKSD
ncbi:MAG: enoyl-CoA hydratase-related protein, partial [Candidatus Thermoplasmatota archaeon]|nr:enoyl-CoA hydratase-related protein [Candidatus Thermoplasmatota archaeon]